MKFLPPILYSFRSKMIFVSIAFVILLGCGVKSVSTKSIFEKSFVNIRSNKKIDFEPEMISHFPKRTSNLSYRGMAAYAFENNQMTYILIEQEIPIEKCKEIIESIEKRALCKYTHEDPCIPYVLHPSDSATVALTPYSCSSMATKYPVLDLKTSLNDSGPAKKVEMEEYIIYVLDVGTTDICNLKFQPNRMMPENQKNGYSKGITISAKSKTIVYWTTCW